jgi:hypothetical protein
MVVSLWQRVLAQERRFTSPVAHPSLAALAVEAVNSEPAARLAARSMERRSTVDLPDQ